MPPGGWPRALHRRMRRGARLRLAAQPPRAAAALACVWQPNPRAQPRMAVAGHPEAGGKHAAAPRRSLPPQRPLDFSDGGGSDSEELGSGEEPWDSSDAFRLERADMWSAGLTPCRGDTATGGPPPTDFPGRSS